MKNVTIPTKIAVTVADTVSASVIAEAIIAPREPTNKQVPVSHTQKSSLFLPNNAIVIKEAKKKAATPKIINNNVVSPVTTAASKITPIITAINKLITAGTIHPHVLLHPI